MNATNQKKNQKNNNNEKKKKSLFQLIQDMTVSEKIKLAMKGDKEARTILMQDGNRMVQLAVLENPRITESEVVNICRSRNVDDEVLRRIANSREWSKLYQVRFSLVTNPKTPVAVSMRFISTLMANDLKSLAKSKSVPTAVATAARRAIARK
ncbi:MAG TPA: hypothetical protein ENG51_23005 [Deltaproteobacteria bacterium]|nr:hypothetical protein [Deltaproteobacteria bacterium]